MIDSAFQFSNNNPKINKAKFIKISGNSKELSDPTLLNSTKNLLKNKWKLELPKLIISITGGARDFTVPKELEKEFKRGLFKAASTTNAWILSGGTNYGVMKWVGDMLDEEVHTENIVCLGIADFAMLAYNKEIDKHLEGTKENKEKKQKYVYYYKEEDQNNCTSTSAYNAQQSRPNNPSFLNRNHTHFILIENTENSSSYGGEIDFRTHLEKVLRSNEDVDGKHEIPLILIVVNGGINTFWTVKNAVNNSVPVLLLAGSNRCADDLICIMDKIDKIKLYEEKKDENDARNAIEKIKTEAIEIIKNYNKQDNKQSLIDFELLTKGRHFLKDFGLKKMEGRSKNFEDAIIEAFLLTEKTTPLQNLELALKWNKLDIAKEQIENIGEIKDDLLEENNENIKLFKKRYELFTDALKYNRPDFIELFTKFDEQLFKKYLTIHKFKDLFYPKTKSNQFFWRLLKKLGNEIFENWTDYYTYRYNKENINDTTNIENNKIFLNNLDKVIKKLTFDSLDISLEVDDNLFRDDSPLKYPEACLFLWALLTNKIEIAEIFCKLSEDPIAHAVVGSKILYSISKRIQDLQEILLKYSDEFEKKARGTSRELFFETHDLLNTGLMLHITPFYNQSLLALGENCNCKRFISEPGVQSVLDEIWNFKLQFKFDKLLIFHSYLIYYAKLFVSVVSLGFLAPFVLVDNSECYDELNEFEKAIVNEIHQDCKIRDNYLLKQHMIDFFYEDAKNSDSEYYYYVGDDVSKIKQDVDIEAQNNSVQENTSFIKEKIIYEKNCFDNWINRFYNFWQSPKTVFIRCFISYTIFITLFSKYVLESFEEKPTQSRIIYVLIAYVSAFFVEEFNELFSYDLIIKAHQSYIKRIYNNIKKAKEESKKITFFLDKALKNGLYHHSKRSIWNWFDSCGILLFFIAIICFAADDHFSFDIAKMSDHTKLIFVLDFIIWSIRYLYYFQLIKVVGKTLKIIELIMIQDLVFFLVIVTITFITFGIVFQSNELPHDTENISPKRIVDTAFWSIFGHTDSLGKIIGDSNEFEYANKSGQVMSWHQFNHTMLGLYLIVILVLVNILIAMLNQTFNTLYSNAELRWKYDRYAFVLTYAAAPVFPPPFSLFVHMINLIHSIWKFISRSKDSDKRNKPNSHIMRTLQKLKRKCAEEYLKKNEIN